MWDSLSVLGAKNPFAPTFLAIFWKTGVSRSVEPGWMGCVFSRTGSVKKQQVAPGSSLLPLRSELDGKTNS